jgi:cytochrome c-type biogenesis protein CcmH
MNPKQILILAVVVVLLTLVRVQVVFAQEGAAAPAAGAATANDVNEVAKELWCPLCSGVRLDACELRACDQMKDVIADKLSAGESTQNIKDYFVQQYGPQVLGAPPLEGFNWLAWILPVVVFVGGGVFLWSRTRHMVRQPKPAAVNSAPVEPGDRYAQELEKELKQYD